MWVVGGGVKVEQFDMMACELILDNFHSFSEMSIDTRILNHNFRMLHHEI